MIFKASLCSASLLIHDGATNFRELVYDFTLLSSLREFEFCIHVLPNMPYKLCWEPYFKMVKILLSLTLYKKGRWISFIWVGCCLKRRPYPDHCYSYIFVFIARQNYCKNYVSDFGFNPTQIMLGYSYARLAIVNIWCFCPSTTNPYGPKEAGDTRQHEQWIFNKGRGGQ